MTAAQPDRLQYYLEAARNASPSTAVQICQQATSDPDLHVFAELLAMPNISALKDTPHEPYLQLLRLFAHGTVQDHTANPHFFPPLTTEQLRKLRALSLISLATGRSQLPFALLRSRLQLPTNRDVQQVVVDAVYAGLVRARINQRDEVIEISSTVGRDVRVECIPEMAASLRAWVQRSGALVEEIDEKMAFITNQTVLAAEHKRQAAAEAVAVRKDFIMNGANRLRHLGVIGREDMDMMERSMSGERDKNTRSTRSRFDA